MRRIEAEDLPACELVRGERGKSQMSNQARPATAALGTSRSNSIAV